jgi:hypothetical protein
LRRTFVSGLNALGANAVHIEKCVNHSSGTLAGVAGIYNVYAYLEEKKAVWEMWRKHVADITEVVA